MSHYYSIIEINEKNNVEVMAEIGVYKSGLCKALNSGYSHFREYWAIDHWGPPIPKNIGWGNNMYRTACSLMKYFKALRVLRMHSVEASELFPDKYFDFVYIDADHSYEAVKEDVKLWLPKTGLIGGHDYFGKGARHPGVKKAVDEVFGENNINIYSGTVWLYDNR